MTDQEAEAVKALSRVRFPPCSWDKRFTRGMAGMNTITEKEAPQVWRLLIRYRRQIVSPSKLELLEAAGQLAAPDLRKVQAEQAAIERYKRAMQPA